MGEWKHFDINFSECKYHDDLHDELKHKLDFMDGYGKNLDALWDCITGYMYTPAYITIRGAGKLPQSLISEFEGIMSVFKDAEIMYGEIRVTVVA